MKVTRSGVAKIIFNKMQDHEPPLSLKELSDKSGVGLSKLKMIVSDTVDKTGNKRLPNTDDLLALSNALDISPYELLTGIEDKNHDVCEKLGLSNDTVNRLRDMNNFLVKSAIDSLVDDWHTLEHIYEYLHSDFTNIQRVFKEGDETKIEWFPASELSQIYDGDFERIARLRLLDDLDRMRKEVKTKERKEEEP